MWITQPKGGLVVFMCSGKFFKLSHRKHLTFMLSVPPQGLFWGGGTSAETLDETKSPAGAGSTPRQTPSVPLKSDAAPE